MVGAGPRYHPLRGPRPGAGNGTGEGYPKGGLLRQGAGTKVPGGSASAGALGPAAEAPAGSAEWLSQAPRLGSEFVAFCKAGRRKKKIILKKI